MKGNERTMKGNGRNELQINKESERTIKRNERKIRKKCGFLHVLRA